MTGGEALDIADLADMAREATGRAIIRQVTSEDAMIENARQAALPEGILGIMLGDYRAARAGEFAAVDPALGQVLGRPPRRMRDVLPRELG